MLGNTLCNSSCIIDMIFLTMFSIFLFEVVIEILQAFCGLILVHR